MSGSVPLVARTCIRATVDHIIDMDKGRNARYPIETVNEYVFGNRKGADKA